MAKLGNRLVTLALTAAICINQPAFAEPVPTMAIIDTALDTSIPEIKNNLVYEVCILDWNSCPNGSSFMEGTGASTMPKALINLNGFGHGTQMTSTAIRTYPKLQFVFIRIIANSSSGARLSTSEETIVRALDWVYKNKDRFNFVSIGLAQSHHQLRSTKQYCPLSTRSSEAIRRLLNVGIPLFVASGNNNDKDRVSWPACIPEAMAVSAITNQTISRYSNFDPQLSDFAAIGEMKVMNVGRNITSASGTSIATHVMAALWTQVRVEFPGFTFQETLEFLNSVSTEVSVGNAKLACPQGVTGLLCDRGESPKLRWVSADALNLEIFRRTSSSNEISKATWEELIRCNLLEERPGLLRSQTSKNRFCPN